MKTKSKFVRNKPVRRNLFGELREGIAALTELRQGKRILSTHTMQYKPAPKLNAKDVKRARERLHLSRGEFAVFLRTNPRTLENWEQGRAKPNAQAGLLIRLLNKYPDTAERLANV